MPYVDRDRRGRAATAPASAGELTFAIQQLLKTYIDRWGSPSYGIYAECLGALRGAELDLWDRKIQPYEVLKKELNGDVW